jgi:hypothetical protein
MWCQGWSEPNAGSDAAAIETTATKKNGKYILNGTKTFITNGTICDFVTVAAYTNPTKRGTGINLFVVERGDPGFSVIRKLRKLGIVITQPITHYSVVTLKDYETFQPDKGEDRSANRSPNDHPTITEEELIELKEKILHHTIEELVGVIQAKDGDVLTIFGTDPLGLPFANSGIRAFVA